MSLERIWQLAGELFSDHWMKALGACAMLLLGRMWGRRRARRDWEHRQFLHRLMVSLNSIGTGPDGRARLLIRTIVEKDIAEVLLNRIAVEKVLAAASHTTETRPILPLAAEDRWALLNAVLNEIAEHFAAGAMAADMGLPVVSHRYVVCLTHEVAGPVRTRKIRAMLVRRDLLEGGAFEDLAVEHAHHSTRLDTLRCMREALRDQPDLFLDVELALPAGAARSGSSPGVVAAGLA